MNLMSKSLTAVKLTLVLIFLSPLTAIADKDLAPGAARVLRFEQRYVNRELDTLKIMALQNYQAAEYSPENAQVFEVKSYWVSAEKLNVFEASEEHNDIGLELKRVENGQRQVLFMVHPESESFYAEFLKDAELGPKFEGTATASSRTLMMWPSGHREKAFFGKLSLNKEIGGVVRTIPQGEVARSVGVTQILDAARNELPQNFDYLPEFFGAMPKGMERGGMILRAIPKRISKSQKTAMPMFAIYTRPDAQTHSPLEIMLSQTKLSAKEFLVRQILRPFAQQWVDLVVEHGIAIEAHAQNVLMEVNSRGMPTGKFIYRDFGGFNIDLKLRIERHLAMPKSLPVIEGLAKDYHQEFHQKAQQQSLQNYFEGGFLFGLGGEFVRLGFKDLDYLNLMAIFRTEVRDEFAKRRISLDGNRFYQTLLPAIEEARKASATKKVLSCEALL